ncbi:hypothetical protein [Ornithinimicrobium cavernae]|uniref:hypothetical protein n=1 Tax=Ornithinimicrobium cavernae TaxID=2666047 RepID=UPI000D6871D4|nr:hypothetical protein [Ornithinimicrobium cavernae]
MTTSDTTDTITAATGTTAATAATGATGATGATEALSASHRRPDRRTLAAGWTTVTIAVLHTVYFAFHPYWGLWLAGPARAEVFPQEAATIFWALPGGFVIPLAVLGLLMIGAGRRGEVMPRYVGRLLTGWVLLCVWIVGPSGFLLGLVPAALLLWPRRQ